MSEVKPCPFCGDPMKRGVMKAVASMGPNVRGVHIQSVVCWEHESGHGYCPIANHKFADNEEEVSRWNNRTNADASNAKIEAGERS